MIKKEHFKFERLQNGAQKITHTSDITGIKKTGIITDLNLISLILKVKTPKQIHLRDLLTTVKRSSSKQGEAIATSKQKKMQTFTIKSKVLRVETIEVKAFNRRQAINAAENAESHFWKQEGEERRTFTLL